MVWIVMAITIFLSGMYVVWKLLNKRTIKAIIFAVVIFVFIGYIYNFLFVRGCYEIRKSISMQNFKVGKDDKNSLNIILLKK